VGQGAAIGQAQSVIEVAADQQGALGGPVAGDLAVIGEALALCFGDVHAFLLCDLFVWLAIPDVNRGQARFDCTQIAKALSVRDCT
jgi:hypothetical protein